MMRFKCGVAVLLIAAVYPLFAGGQRSGSSSGQTSAGPAEIEFVYMSTGWKAPKFGEDPVTARMMERTGVKLKLSAPPGDASQLATVWLASGDYPEMMHMGIGPTYNSYITAGALLPINKLADQYGYTNITNGNYIYPDVYNAHKSDDGNLYLAPNWFSDDGFGSVGQSMNVRNDIYNQLGKPPLDTMDQVYNYLLKVRDANIKSPFGAKLWPLAFGITDNNYLGYMANLWGAQIYKYYYFDPADKKVKLMLRNDATVKMLQWLSRALKDGVLDPDVLTYDNTTQSESYNQQKHAIIFDWFWNLWTPNSAMSQKDPNMYFSSAPAPRGTSGVQQYHGRYTKLADQGTVITKNCKNPEAAIKFINFFLSPEGEILDFYGIEGKTMYFENEQPFLYPEAYEAKLADWEGYAFKAGVRILDIMMNQKYNWERTQESPDRRQNRAMAHKYAFDASVQNTIVVDPLSNEGILAAELDANMKAQFVKIIMEQDQNKIPGLVRDVLAQWEQKGIAKLEAEWTRQYLNSARKMGYYQ
jgi:putative aldouronate transport system substrate-binding protein